MIPVSRLIAHAPLSYVPFEGVDYAPLGFEVIAGKEQGEGSSKAQVFEHGKAAPKPEKAL